MVTIWSDKMTKSDYLLGNNIPWVEAHHIGRKQRPTAIVLRTSYTTGQRGAANGIAQAWHRAGNRVDSCHYVVDEFQTIRCVKDKVASRSAYTSQYKNSISVNVCYDPPQTPMDEVVHRTAVLVARLCKLYKIRPHILSKEEELQWLRHQWRRRGGIILATVGDFPTGKFITSVGRELNSF